ncbi:HlyD family secretion protein [uncultured Cetobacterium sp.]|uniref:HlyD family secretion protein n=1 Tax=uncultured Cetobacterium sp. TaxID=527638 RepID=UPI002636DB25|nr:HlyD family secretion protein [uncultured Cetobacterium sp.]
MENTTNSTIDKKKEVKRKITLFLLGIIIVGILYIIYYIVFLKNYEETENAYIHGNQTVITSQINGVINSINVEDTQSIKKGDTVIRLDSIDYEIALRNAQAQLGNSIRKYYLLQNNILTNKEHLKDAQANFKLSEKTFQRESISNKAGISSAEKFDNITFNYLQSQINLEQSKINLENSFTDAKSSSMLTHPLVASAIENLKTAFYNLEKTKIASPISGIIAQKQVFLGQQVSTGQPLFTVVDLNSTWVNANFKETQLGNIKAGNPVEIVSDVNGKVYHGVVSGIAGGSGSAFALIPTQNATGNWIKIVQRVPVRIDIFKESLAKNGVLPIGTSLTVKVNTVKTIDIPNEFQEKISTLYQINLKELNNLIEQTIKDNSL